MASQPADKDALVSILRRGMRTAQHEPFVLSSGATSWEVFDAAEAICDENTLSFVTEAVLASVPVEFEAVAGPALGAGPVAYAAGALAGKRSFLVRPEKKGHGAGGQFKGRFVPGDRILVVDDVVTTGGSLIRAMRTIRDEGGIIVAAATLVDRARSTSERIEREFGIPYVALTDYSDYGIEPVAGPGEPAPLSPPSPQR
jgi:orotate phosphoribosyltransferase